MLLFGMLNYGTDVLFNFCTGLLQLCSLSDFNSILTQSSNQSGKIYVQLSFIDQLS